jgi:hypothetical protein
MKAALRARLVVGNPLVRRMIERGALAAQSERRAQREGDYPLSYRHAEARMAWTAAAVLVASEAYGQVKVVTETVRAALYEACRTAIEDQADRWDAIDARNAILSAVS